MILSARSERINRFIESPQKAGNRDLPCAIETWVSQKGSLVGIAARIDGCSSHSKPYLRSCLCRDRSRAASLAHGKILVNFSPMCGLVLDLQMILVSFQTHVSPTREVFKLDDKFAQGSLPAPNH